MAVVQPPIRERRSTRAPLIALGVLAGVALIALGLYMAFGGGGGGGETGARNAATSTHRVAGMTIAVPTEWRRVPARFGQGFTGIYMTDPQHERGGLTFSVFSARSPETLMQVGTNLRMSVANDPMFSNVRTRMITLPAGTAVRMNSTVTKSGTTYSDVKFGFAHAGRVYVVTFMGLPSIMADHAAQIDAAARSVRFVPAGSTAPSPGVGTTGRPVTITKFASCVTSHGGRAYISALKPNLEGFPGFQGEVKLSELGGQYFSAFVFGDTAEAKRFTGLAAQEYGSDAEVRSTNNVVIAYFGGRHEIPAGKLESCALGG